MPKFVLTNFAELVMFLAWLERWEFSKRDLECYIGVGKKLMQARIGNEETGTIAQVIQDQRLLIAALISGAARWEFLTGSQTDGEICTGGLRFSTVMDSRGVPKVTEQIRHALNGGGTWQSLAPK